VTAPGIPNEYSLSTICFGARLGSIQDQIFAAVGMGFRRLELGLAESPPSMDGLDESKRETGVSIRSLVAGCRDPLNGSMAAERLASLVSGESERALNSIRRHVRLAKSWGCRTIVLRGSKTEDPKLSAQARSFEDALDKDDDDAELRERVRAFVVRLQKSSHRQIEQFCRSLHQLMRDEPEMIYAIEPGREMDDLFGFEAIGWILEDFESDRVRYWHDVGRIHLREKFGLPSKGQWLESYSARMSGIHLQDAGDDEAEMPLGLGEVDFRLISEYTPRAAERVVEIGPRHGRAEILSSVQFLVDLGF
jgi:hypothetical protein